MPWAHQGQRNESYFKVVSSLKHIKKNITKSLHTVLYTSDSSRAERRTKGREHSGGDEAGYILKPDQTHPSSQRPTLPPASSPSTLAISGAGERATIPLADHSHLPPTPAKRASIVAWQPIHLHDLLRRPVGTAPGLCVCVCNRQTVMDWLVPTRLHKRVVLVGWLDCYYGVSPNRSTTPQLCGPRPSTCHRRPARPTVTQTPRLVQRRPTSRGSGKK